MSETTAAKRYMTKPKTRRYTFEVSVEVVEDLESSWHKPFTEAQAKVMAKELVHKGWLSGGSYAAEVKRITLTHKEVVA